ncbi:MAG TPA: ABC transporter substrate-binding protein [Dehalococcoidia bacterium]|jgi:peptide/nickel transport system substrate-binding protein|nr:ABC transporter substrate-binding protein [Dehalococcoidia bacterium]
MAGSYWDKIAAQRVSRRRVLQSAGVAGAAAGAVWLVGCKSSSNNGGKTSTSGGGTPEATAGAGFANGGGTPKAGGRYNVGTSVDFDTFDPHISIAGGVAYFPRLYNAVINRSPRDASFKFDDLASSLEQPDNTTYIFHLRDNVMVGPNKLGIPERAMDGNDIKASFDRIKNLPQSNAYAFVGEWIDSVDVSADAKTVTIKTPKPYGYFFLRIGSAINLIVPKELIDQADKMKNASAGGGPFVLNPGDYTEGQNALLTKNPTYYRKDDKNNNAQLPYLDEMFIKIISDRSALQTAFKSQQTDQYTAQNVDESNSLQSGNNYTIVRDSTNTFIAVTLNPTKDPWKDDRMRKAVGMALNRDEYVQRVYKGEAKPNGIVHWSLGDYALPPDEVAKLQPYDPKGARDLIKAATGKDTVDVTFMWPADSIIEEHNQHLPIWLQQMQDAGFNVNKDPQAFTTWLDNYTNLKYDASLALNQVYEYAEFEMDFEHSEGPARNHIYTIGVGALYPEIDAAIDESKGITDPEQQAAKVRDVQRQIYDKGPMFYPLVTPFSFTLYQPYVKNIPTGLGASGLFLNTTWLDK